MQKMLVQIWTAIILLQSEVVWAQSAAPQHPPSISEVFMRTLPMIAMIFLIMYFLVLKPQQRKLTDQQKLLTDLKRGDRVTTTGGVIGRVASVEPDCVVLEIASNTKVKFERQHILKRLEAENGKSQAA